MGAVPLASAEWRRVWEETEHRGAGGAGPIR